MIKLDVQKRLGDFTLDAQFVAPAGVTAIFGRSGSGKTTLINAIAGLLTPDAGTIALNGRTLFGVGTNVPTAKRNVGYVFQDARLFPHMTVGKNLTYGGNHDFDRIVDLLGLASLLARRPTALSGGEKQRVALGRALMSKPDVLLLDEPLAALDSARKAEVLPYLERLRDTGGPPMIYVSHAMSEVARLATHLVVLDAGRVVQSGPLGDVLAHPASMPLLGVRDAGAVIIGAVTGYDTDDQLTHLSFDAGHISLPGHIGQIGQSIRLRIPAQDIILAGAAPVAISARNVLPVTITALEQGRGPGVAVGLQAGQARLLARITKASLREMNLSVGDQVFAIIKATAVAPENVGR